MPRYSFIVLERLDSFRSPDDLHKKLVDLSEAGYEGVEFSLTEPSGIDLDQLQSWTRDLGLEVPSFLTGEAYNDGLCLSSPLASIRRQTVERLISYVDVADRFGAILVIGLLQGLRSDEPDPEKANGRITECLRQVADVAEAKGVDCVMEPVNHLQVGFNNSVGEVLQLIEKIGSHAIRPMVDTVHMNIEESSQTSPILRCGDQLRHVHLCESNGARFGSGHVDFSAVLQALDEIDYTHFASVKVYRNLAWKEAVDSSLGCLKNL